AVQRRSQAQSTSLDQSLPPVFFPVFFVEKLLPVVEVDGGALDVGLLDSGGDFQDVAVRDEEGGVLARFERADAVGHAEYLGRVEGDGLEGFIARQAVGRGGGGVIRQIHGQCRGE